MKIIGTVGLIVLLFAAVLAVGGWGTQLLINLLHSEYGALAETDFVTGVKLFGLVAGLAWLASPAKGGE
jgi:hypothetical protein